LFRASRSNFGLGLFSHPLVYDSNITGENGWSNSLRLCGV
jgi:hypothetical protein